MRSAEVFRGLLYTGWRFDGALDADHHMHSQLTKWKIHLCLNTDWLQVQQGAGSCLLLQLFLNYNCDVT